MFVASLRQVSRRRRETESEEGVEWQALDTKPGELTMVRAKVR